MTAIQIIGSFVIGLFVPYAIHREMTRGHVSMLQRWIWVLVAASFVFVLMFDRARAESPVPSTDRAALYAAAKPHLRGHQIIRHVAVSHGYALLMISDEHSGGELVFQKIDATWKKIGGGGGVAAAKDLAALYHVPIAIALTLVSEVESAPSLLGN